MIEALIVVSFAGAVLALYLLREQSKRVKELESYVDEERYNKLCRHDLIRHEPPYELRPAVKGDVMQLRKELLELAEHLGCERQEARTIGPMWIGKPRF